MGLFFAVLLLVTVPAGADEIAWFKGDVPSALAEGARLGKPLFIYWGAAWCPPCNILKATAFRDRDFVTASREFVAVYLDGDGKDAQLWAERLHANGYPTLMVLNSRGDEIKRLSANASVTSLTASLIAAGRDATSIDDVVTQALGPSELPEARWSRLAEEEWFNTTRFDDDPARLAKTLGALAERCPPKYSDPKFSLRIKALIARVIALHPEEKLDQIERAEGRGLLRRLRNDSATFTARASMLSFWIGDLIKATYVDESDEVERMTAALAFREKFAALIKSQPPRRRDDGWIYPLFQLSRGSDHKFPALIDAEAANVRSLLRERLRNARDETARHAVLNTLTYAYLALGAVDEAKRILLNHVARMKAKNEVFSNLARLEAQQAHYDAALKYAERAYGAADGPATHLQWGVIFAGDLMRYAPQREGPIKELVATVARDGLHKSDGFRGRSYGHLKRLAGRFADWAKGKHAFLDPKVVAEFVAACPNADDEVARRCRAFVLKLGGKG